MYFIVREIGKQVVITQYPEYYKSGKYSLPWENTRMIPNSEKEDEGYLFV